jgi:hypothetical protein
MTKTASVPEYRIIPDSDIVGAAANARKFRQQLIQYLQHRLEQGNSYVRVNDVKREFDVNGYRAGQNLGRLADGGLLEPWRDTTNATTYRIRSVVRDTDPSSVRKAWVQE